jgi:hypothetical protein
VSQTPNSSVISVQLCPTTSNGLIRAASDPHSGSGMRKSEREWLQYGRDETQERTIRNNIERIKLWKHQRGGSRNRGNRFGRVDRVGEMTVR